jgi:hypothetical protein
MADNQDVAREAVDIDALVESISGANRRRRQEAAHVIALEAKEAPETLLGHVDALVDALYRPEAKTRWEILSALTEIASIDADAVADAFDGAEASLFDEASSMVRLMAFLFLARLGSTSPERSDAAWPLLDEAVQCYHGDAEYHDMLKGLIGLASGNLSEATAKALEERVKFDAENGIGFIKSLSSEILQILKG